MTEKNKGKKLLTWTLALSMTLALPPVGVFAEDGAGSEGSQQTNSAPATEQPDGSSKGIGASNNEGTEPVGTPAEGGQNTQTAPPSGTLGTSTPSGEGQKGGNETLKPLLAPVSGGETEKGESNPASSEGEDGSGSGTTGEVKDAATIDGKEGTYETLQAAIDEAKDGDTVVLAKDVTENISINKSITLDLNGKTLSGNGTNTVVRISTQNDAEIVVLNGTITGGNTSYSGGGFDIQSGKVTIKNCTIKNNTAKIAGGGLNISGSANVEIIGCKINDNIVIGSSGGAIYQASGYANNGYYNNTCKIVDTELKNNRAVVGGAVGMGASLYHDGITNAAGGKGVTATFIMEGESVIDGNTASYRGGGVYLTGNGSRFLMKDGTISNNSTTGYEGGGIWATNYGGVTIENGTIRDNTAKTYGGAIYMKANISETNDSAKLAVENGLRDCLNLGTALVTGNKAKQGGGICIDSYNSAFGIKADLAQASIYNNHASVRGDDIYSTGVGTPGCTIQLGEISNDWKLSCGADDTVDGWYIDGKIDSKIEEGFTARWNAHPDKGELYAKEYTQRENLTGALALKAAHEQLYKVTVHYVYSDGATAKEDAVINVKAGTDYSINSPAIEGYKADKATVSGTISAETPADTEITVTYTKESSGGGGGGGGHRPKPKPTVEIPDDDALGLNNTDHFAYIVGYGNGEVQPQNSITRAEVAAIFFRLLEDGIRNENFTHQNDFSDVAADAWYCSSVSTLSRMGIIAGYPDGTFRPNAPITRAEFAAIATRFDNNGDKTPVSFTDIIGHWAEGEITVAANHGWVSGYGDNTFRPQNQITRAETMSLVNRVLKRLPETPADLLPDMITWTDNADTSSWYYLPVQEATNSHYYEFKENSTYEKWTELRETRDWSKLG